jgi:IclR family transcriptional regulator, acetate operon repressor
MMLIRKTFMDDSTKTVAKYPITSVSKAAKILALLTDTSQIRLSDVAAHIDVAASTAHRMLTTLEAEGLLMQDPVTRCYVPGPVLVDIAAGIGPKRTRWEAARSYMAQLGTLVGETINLVCLQGTDAVFVESVESNNALRVSSRQGTVLPAHAVSGGKALLAQLSREELDLLYPESDLESLTENTLTTRSALLEELEQISARGYATNFGEGERDIGGVAVLVSGDGESASTALAVSAPSARLTPERIEELIPPLKATAALLHAAGL